MHGVGLDPLNLAHPLLRSTRMHHHTLVRVTPECFRSFLRKPLSQATHCAQQCFPLAYLAFSPSGRHARAADAQNGRSCLCKLLGYPATTQAQVVGQLHPILGPVVEAQIIRIQPSRVCVTRGQYNSIRIHVGDDDDLPSLESQYYGRQPETYAALAWFRYLKL